MTIRHTLWTLALLAAACTEFETISPVPVEHLDAGIDSLVMSPGESLLIAVHPRDSAGALLYDRVITLSSTAPGTVSIDSTGRVAAIAVGNAWLRFASEEASDSIPVRVTSSWVDGVIGDPNGISCLIRPDEKRWCWGWQQPQWGLPVEVPNLPQFASMDGGYQHDCAVAVDSTGWCWGPNHYGELGTASNLDAAAPAPVQGGHHFRSIGAGRQSSCGVTVDGVGLCWGRGDFGIRGDSTYTDSSAPDTVYGGHLWTVIEPGDYRTCGLSTAGVVYCWGGDYPWMPSDTIPQNWLIPHPVAGAPTLATLTVGGDFACGLDSGGLAWCWGDYQEGQTGHAGSAPGLVNGAPSFTELVAAYASACGLDADGGAWCWGTGGWLGDGTWEKRREASPVLGGHRFVHLIGGWAGHCGITAGGAVWCWGGHSLWSENAIVPRRVLDP